MDTEDNEKPLLNLCKLCMTNDLTLLVAWSEQEAARYIETYKVPRVFMSLFFTACLPIYHNHYVNTPQSYEKKGADSIMEQTESTYISK
jgi:hypothetical protein